MFNKHLCIIDNWILHFPFQTESSKELHSYEPTSHLPEEDLKRTESLAEDYVSWEAGSAVGFEDAIGYWSYLEYLRLSFKIFTSFIKLGRICNCSWRQTVILFSFLLLLFFLEVDHLFGFVILGSFECNWFLPELFQYRTVCVGN